MIFLLVFLIKINTHPLFLQLNLLFRYNNPKFCLINFLSTIKPPKCLFKIHIKLVNVLKKTNLIKIKFSIIPYLLNKILMEQSN